MTDTASFYTVAQTAKHLGLHPKTVLRFIHDGRLPAARIGKSYRLLRDEVMRFAGGAAAGAPAQPGARVTSIVEIDALSPEQAERLATALQATLVGREAGASPVSLQSAYDPAQARLTCVLIAAPAEAAKWLGLAQMLMDAVR
jgi:excisionase family DNA binding protein